MRGDYVDKVRNRLDEARKSRNRKLLIGVLAVVFIMMCAFSVERNISNRIEDVSIDKSNITDEKAIFIPLKKLDTDIIAVKTQDGSYRLAFNDCTGCYYESGKHGRYKNNADNTGLVCDTCGSEVIYEDMGFLTEESMPYPIAETEIMSDEDSFVIPAEYLSVKKQILEGLRSGKIENEYKVKSENN